MGYVRWISKPSKYDSYEISMEKKKRKMLLKEERRSNFETIQRIYQRKEFFDRKEISKGGI